MNRVRLGVLAALIAGAGCGPETPDPQEKVGSLEGPPTAFDEPLPRYFPTIDTTMRNGDFVRYAGHTDSTYIIRWGNDRFRRELRPWDYTRDVNVPYVGAVTEHAFVLLGGSRMNDGHFALILPRDPERPVEIRFEPLAGDTTNELIVYPEFPESERAETWGVVVEHYPTGERQTVTVPTCPAVNFTRCVDSLSFRHCELYLRVEKGEALETVERRERLHLGPGCRRPGPRPTPTDTPGGG